MVKSKIFKIVLAVMVILFLFLVAKFGMQPLDMGQSGNPKLVKAANNINKKCPVLIDKDTRLDNVKSYPGNILQYNYTVINYTKEQLNIEDVKNKMSVILLKQVRSDDDLKSFRDDKVTLSYSYKDKNGAPLFILKFSYDDYK